MVCLVIPMGMSGLHRILTLLLGAKGGRASKRPTPVPASTPQSVVSDSDYEDHGAEDSDAGPDDLKSEC